MIEIKGFDLRFSACRYEINRRNNLEIYVADHVQQVSCGMCISQRGGGVSSVVFLPYLQ
jgi:hypothetical protein